MARLHEYQGKALLRSVGILTPRGEAARTPDEAAKAAAALGGPCVVKVQAWTTGRAAAGGVAFAADAEEARRHAGRMLAMKFGNFPVTEVLVEERISIARELFVSLAIDERERAPVLLISSAGGSGVEERASAARRVPCSVAGGPDAAALRDAIASLGVAENLRAAIEAAARAVFEVARRNEARSVEINPLVITSDGKVMAADCRVTIDDYAVARHPELGIEIARELDHPPTELEKIAYRVEQEDHRGTFFFAQMNLVARLSEPGEMGAEGVPSSPGSENRATQNQATKNQATKGLIGFHGAGGGGSMMSMDAITNEGFTIANFCDTSGNPSPAKVYRAARIILAQPGLIGYFGSGSGVANQEQFWSAYGLAKAFWEMEIDIPVVIRLGGNTEDRAVEILQSACKGLAAKVEAYKKSDPPAKIAARFAAMVAEAKGKTWRLREPRRPGFVGRAGAVKFEVKGGRVWIDEQAWKKNGAAIISRANGFFRDDSGKPAITVKPDEFLMKDSDMIACEVECRRDGIDGLFVEIDIPGLDQFIVAGKGGR